MLGVVRRKLRGKEIIIAVKDGKHKCNSNRPYHSAMYIIYTLNLINL